MRALRACLVAALLLLPGGAHAQTNIWIPGSIVVNPSINDVLVTTATLARSNLRVTVYVYATVGVPVLLQRRTSGGTVLTSILIPAYPTFIMWSSPTPVLVQDGDTIRVIAQAGATTTAQVTLILATQ